MKREITLDPHIDSTSDGFHDDWIWNVNIQLTNPNDYTDGELIHKNQSYKIQKGNLYFYRSNELHGVNEVTNGLRYCIVFYIKKNDFKNKKTTDMSKKYKVILISGGFDPVHKAPHRMYSKYQEVNDEVWIGLNNDDWLRRKKGKSFMKEKKDKLS